MVLLTQTNKLTSVQLVKRFHTFPNGPVKVTTDVQEFQPEI